MSATNDIFENDLLMRAILEGGQEEVPGHIWDAVSDGLDKAAEDRRRKTVTLWWRRAGVSVAAVAAAVASVLVLSRPEPADIVPAAVHGDMIAVVAGLCGGLLDRHCPDPGEPQQGWLAQKCLGISGG